jgi:hypothetical protein
MLERGGRMIEARSVPKPGEWIISSELSLGANYDSLAEEAAVPLRTRDLRVRTPLRLLDRYAHSGFEAAAFGLLPFSFSARPLDRIAYSRTSSFLDIPANWTPTQIAGHLVYLAIPGDQTHLPLAASAAQLHFALFARGKGQTTFRIRTPSGAVIFDERVLVEGNLWEVHDLSPAGMPEVILQVDASRGLQAGWGDLVDTASPVQAAAHSQWQFQRPYLKMGDLRSKPQLLSGWYPIEDGAWRWMAKEAEVTLPAPAGVGTRFAMQLFLPSEPIQRTAGPMRVTVTINGRMITSRTYFENGRYLLEAPVPAGLAEGAANRVNIRWSRALRPAGSDRRELGAVVTELGFVAAPDATLAR